LRWRRNSLLFNWLKPRTLIIVIEYDGTEFAGWQVQPGKRTVQGELEAALEKLTGESHRVVAAGRTDSGVHAWGQVAHCKTSSDLEPHEFRGALNSLLPRDAVVLDVRDGPAGFDARRHARGKIYRYIIINRRERPAIERNRAWHVREPLDVAAMRRGARFLLGEHDFRSFRGQKCASKTTVRVIRRIDVNKEPPDKVIIEVEATALLRQMIRAIAGTLVEVGRRKWLPGRVLEALNALDRRMAGPTAPPQGLYLAEVQYDETEMEEV